MISVSRRGALAAIVATFLVNAGALTPAGALTEAEAFVARVADEVLAAARASDAIRFSYLVNRYSAIDEIALFALGRYRRRLPAQHKDEYLQLARDFVTEMFTKNAGALAGEHIRIIKSVGDIVDAEIVFANGRTMPVKWRLIRASGSYRVFDVNVSGVWLGITMQSAFGSILGETGGDFRALIEYMHTGRRPAVFRR